MYVRQHPGTVIRELWLGDESPAAAARRIGVPLQELRLLLEGRVPLTPRLAAKLAAAGWSNAAFWLRLQDAYDQAPEQQRLDAQAATPLPAPAP